MNITNKISPISVFYMEDLKKKMVAASAKGTTSPAAHPTF